MPIVNGHQAEAGCYIDGHWGQYGPDRLAEIAEGFGYVFDGGDDPRHWRAAAERADEDRLEHSYWDHHVEAADDIERWLNDHTSDGFVWHWRDGEFFLSPRCDDDDCDDDTCAHWE